MEAAAIHIEAAEQEVYNTETFIKTHNFLTRDPAYAGLNGNDRDVYSYIRSRFEYHEQEFKKGKAWARQYIDKNGVFHTIADNISIAHYLNISTRTVSRCKKKLVKVGLLRIERQFKKADRLYPFIPAAEVKPCNSKKEIAAKRKEQKEKNRIAAIRFIEKKRAAKEQRKTAGTVGASHKRQNGDSNKRQNGDQYRSFKKPLDINTSLKEREKESIEFILKNSLLSSNIKDVLIKNVDQINEYKGDHTIQGIVMFIERKYKSWTKEESLFIETLEAAIEEVEVKLLPCIAAYLKNAADGKRRKKKQGAKVIHFNNSSSSKKQPIRTEIVPEYLVLNPDKVKKEKPVEELTKEEMEAAEAKYRAKYGIK